MDEEILSVLVHHNYVTLKESWFSLSSRPYSLMIQHILRHYEIAGNADLHERLLTEVTPSNHGRNFIRLKVLACNIDAAIASSLQNRKIKLIEFKDTNIEYKTTSEYDQGNPKLHLDTIYHNKLGGSQHVKALDFFIGTL